MPAVPAHEDDAADDAAALAAHASALADAVEDALPGWVERSVRLRLEQWSGAADPAVLDDAGAAGRAARDDVGPAVRALLGTDVDEQRTNPLAVLRRAVRYPTDVLRHAGVPPVHRDGFAERAFPGDVYDLSPATWSDVDPRLHELGMAWGAAKAYVVLSRRRAEGRR